MMNRITMIAIMLVAISLGLVAGCGGSPDPDPQQPPGIHVVSVGLPDGRTVLCVLYDYDSGAISCNWGP